MADVQHTPRMIKPVNEGSGDVEPIDPIGSAPGTTTSSEQPGSSEPVAALTPGTMIGRRYRLHHVLGRGATGTVWEAEHSLLTSRVAIKFLDSMRTLHDSQVEVLLERFRFEAQISARLASVTDRIVSVHDAGLYKGVPYIVMELAPGETLADRIDRAPLLPTEVAELLDQLASALDAAHRAGFAHRDVKPPNVLCVASEGDRRAYKLADFGVAKLFRDSAMGLVPPKQTSENVLVGSPAYMSPEYVSGVATIDGSGDVWALSVLAYEALTRNIPFEGEAWTQVAVAIVQGTYLAPSHHVPGLGKEIDDLFKRAFARDPSQRFASAGDLARAFRATVDSLVIPEFRKDRTVLDDDLSRPTGETAVSTARDVGGDSLPMNRSKLALWGAALAAALLAGGIAVSTMRGKDAPADAAAVAGPRETSTPSPVVEATPPAPATNAPASSAEPESSAAPTTRPSRVRPPAPSATPATPVPTTNRPRKPVDPSEVL